MTSIQSTRQQPRQAFSYGRAQPIQPQWQGAPYGQPPASQRPAAAVPQAPAARGSATTARQPQGNPFAQYNPQQMGNFVQQQMGLPSFQFTATDPFGNTFNNPAALTAQQGAMAQALNAQRAQQIQSGNIGPLNPMAAYQQAQNMVQGGWTNPFAPPMPNMGNLNNYGYGDTRPQLKSQAQPIQPPSQVVPYSPGTSFYPGGPSQAQPIQPPSQGTPYGPGTSFYPGGPAVAPPAQRQIPPQGVTPVLGAPQVWTNPSDPDWLKQQLQRKPDSRPVVWDERNRRYINNPTFVGAPGYDWPPQQQSYWHALSR